MDPKIMNDIDNLSNLKLVPYVAGTTFRQHGHANSLEDGQTRSHFLFLPWRKLQGKRRFADTDL